MPNIQYLEILLLAVVAGLILFRLYTVLGRRTGHERPPQQWGSVPGKAPAEPRALEPARDNVIPLSGAHREQTADQLSDPVSRALLDIKLADRTFETGHFIAGAKSAYETILAAYARHDRPQLKPLLSKEVYGAFDEVMTAHEKHKETTSFTFVGYKEVKIVHAALKERLAEITVSFAAQFISAVKDASGAVTEGDATAVRDVTDVWTFSRDVRARDPNWTLIATAGELP